MRRVAWIVAVVAAIAFAQPATAAPELEGFPIAPGTANDYVAVAQDRLSWLGYPIDATERATHVLGPSTLTALQAFERKFAFVQRDDVDAATWLRLRTIAGKVGALPVECTTGTVICIDVAQRLLRFVRDGEVVRSTDTRFGVRGQETRRGSFRVQSRSRDHVSTKFHTPMPFALFFSGDQAIHYSAMFARDGYAGGSHGCINLRDRDAARWVFEHAPIGTKVFIS